MKDLLEYIVQNLVAHPDEVKVKEETTSEGVNFILHTDPEDISLVIGRAGQTIKSIRKLLIARSMAENRHIRVNLNLEETK